jgi:hypothetical protein
MPNTDETEFGLWATPCANEDNKSPEAHMAMKARMKGGPRYTVTSLQVQVKMWPTPHGMSKDGKSNGPSGNELGFAVNRMEWTPDAHCYKGGERKNQLGGSLNPTWVEWLMGYPTGWTVLKDSAMQSFRKLRSRSSKA